MKAERKILSKDDRPLYTIGVAAELVGITDQTLRLYERHGLIKPSRKNKNRFYSENDIKWLNCLRDLIHDRKISIEGLKLLLEYAPCWEITNCQEQVRAQCSAFVNKAIPCWELSKKRCGHNDENVCASCVVYLARLNKNVGPAKTGSD
ncbi:MAG: MerR family transcriptional regulator [Candidatus Magnetominusculus sp. LBB02]|nr:MerR family transcriptional regulator [Candidatus Magnetominusculus sp. LBB02]